MKSETPRWNEVLARALVRTAQDTAQSALFVENDPPALRLSLYRALRELYPHAQPWIATARHISGGSLSLGIATCIGGHFFYEGGETGPDFAGKEWARRLASDPEFAHRAGSDYVVQLENGADQDLVIYSVGEKALRQQNFLAQCIRQHTTLVQKEMLEASVPGASPLPKSRM